MNKLYLIRHGETLENRLGILQGRVDTNLTDRGRSQINDIAFQLTENEIDFIYSSPLRRAKDSAKIIKNYFKNIPLIYDNRLQEIDISIYEGKYKNEVPLKWLDYPENGENIEQVYSRIENFLKDITETYKNKNIVVVSHNVIIKTILNNVKYKRFTPIRGDTITNSSLNIVNI